MKKPLVILDLDQTLVHCFDVNEVSDESLRCTHPDFNFKEPLATLSGYIRPGAKAFLVDLFSRCQVAVWSAGSRVYVEQVVQQLFTPKQKKALLFVWTIEECTYRKVQVGLSTFVTYYTKPLEKVFQKFGFKANQVRIIDDTPETYEENPHEALPIPKFFAWTGCAECSQQHNRSCIWLILLHQIVYWLEHQLPSPEEGV